MSKNFSDLLAFCMAAVTHDVPSYVWANSAPVNSMIPSGVDERFEDEQKNWWVAQSLNSTRPHFS